MKVLDILASVLLGAALIIVVYLSWPEMPQYRLWVSIDIPFMENLPYVTLFALLHLSSGVPLFIASVYRTLRIIRVNQAAQGGKNNPLYLIKDGYYEDVRHPMTTAFIFTVVGLFHSMSSLIGLILIVLFLVLFHLVALYEERVWLIPKFGSEYTDYTESTPARYFTRKQAALFIVFIAVDMTGILMSCL